MRRMPHFYTSFPAKESYILVAVLRKETCSFINVWKWGILRIFVSEVLSWIYVSTKIARKTTRCKDTKILSTKSHIIHGSFEMHRMPSVAGLFPQRATQHIARLLEMLCAQRHSVHLKRAMNYMALLRKETCNWRHSVHLMLPRQRDTMRHRCTECLPLQVSFRKRAI